MACGCKARNNPAMHDAESHPGLPPDATATANSCALEVAWMALRAQGLCWIDTHCHLDAPEFDPDREAVLGQSLAQGVWPVMPAVGVSQFERLPEWAHLHGLPYALGIHPLEVERQPDDALQQLDEALTRRREDPLLVAVGEIGLDGWVGAPPMARQRTVYEAQLKLAAKHRLPVILHVRRSADLLLAGLRRVPVSGGIAHAFNGSGQQAQAFVERGFALGFGGTLTYERSRQIRSLLAELPAHAWVLETDAPDIPPSWLYVTAAQRAATGSPSGRNAPHELPRIGGHAAELRGQALDDAAKQSCLNAFRALPGLARALDWRVSTGPRGIGPA